MLKTASRPNSQACLCPKVVAPFGEDDIIGQGDGARLLVSSAGVCAALAAPAASNRGRAAHRGSRVAPAGIRPVGSPCGHGADAQVRQSLYFQKISAPILAHYGLKVLLRGRGRTAANNVCSECAQFPAQRAFSRPRGRIEPRRPASAMYPAFCSRKRAVLMVLDAAREGGIKVCPCRRQAFSATSTERF